MKKLSGKTKRILRKLRSELIDWEMSPFISRSTDPKDVRRKKELSEYTDAINEVLK